MSYDIKKSGERIQRLRIQEGYTQEALANKLSIDRSLLSHIESGKRGCSVDLLVRLSEVFTVSLDVLVLGEERATLNIADREQLRSDIAKLIDRLELFNEKL